MRNFLASGQWNFLCDLCGRKYKSSEGIRNWQGLMVCKQDYEVRHPQDFLRVQKEKIAVPWVRPYPQYDTFINACNIINSQGIAGIGIAGCMVASKIATGQLT